MSQKISGSTNKQATEFKAKVQEFAAQAQKNKGADAGQIRALRAAADSSGFSTAPLAGGRSVKTVLDDLGQMAELQAKNKPRANSDADWEKDIKDLLTVADATVGGTATLDKLQASTDRAKGIAGAAGDGHLDAESVPGLHDKAYGNNGAAKENITETADAAYKAALGKPGATPDEIGKAQRGVMLAFQVQYPTASVDDFKSHMQSMIKASGSTDDVHTAASAQAVQQASFSDIAAITNKQGRGAPVANTKTYEPNGSGDFTNF